MKKFKKTLGHLSVAHGETAQNPSMTPLCGNGCHIVPNNLLIPVSDIADILSFLTHLYNTRLSYSSISTVKSVLSNVVFIPGMN